MAAGGRRLPGLDGASLNGVHRIPANVSRLRRALLEERVLGAAPATPGDSLSSYDVRTVATAVDDLYEILFFAPGRPSGL